MVPPIEMDEHPAAVTCDYHHLLKELSLDSDRNAIQTTTQLFFLNWTHTLSKFLKSFVPYFKFCHRCEISKSLVLRRKLLSCHICFCLWVEHSVWQVMPRNANPYIKAVAMLAETLALNDKMLRPNELRQLQSIWAKRTYLVSMTSSAEEIKVEIRKQEGTDFM